MSRCAIQASGTYSAAGGRPVVTPGPATAGTPRTSPPGRVPSGDRRVGVLQQLVELGGEPVPGQRGVRQRTARVVGVADVAAVVRVAHLVEALALVIGDGLAGTVGLTGRLDPRVRVEAGGRSRGRACAQS